MKIMCDVDGVLIDMMRSLKVCLANKGITFYPENVETYGFDGDIGCSKDVVYDCLQSKTLFNNLFWIDGAYTALVRLMKNNDVFAYTCANENVIHLRQSMCDYIGLEGQVYEGFNKPVIMDADVVIDDSPKVCLKWLNEKPDTLIFLVDQTYNRDVKEDGIIRVKHIREVEKYLKNMVDKH